MKRNTIQFIVAVSIAAIVLLAAIGGLSQIQARPPLGPTNLDALHLNCFDCATATPVFLANQRTGAGAGVIASFQLNSTPVATITGSGLDASSVLLGSNHPLQYSAANYELSCGTATVTGTAQITPTGLTTVTKAWPIMAAPPSAAVGGAFLATITRPTTSTFNVNLWQDDATVATLSTTIDWCAIGNR